MTNNIVVSLIVPSRNEEKFIKKCLNSILLQDFPKDKLEVLVVDGMSKDNSRNIAEEYSRKYSFIKILDNLKKTTPFAMNLGIKKAEGEIIMKMDAHTVYQKDYISKCVLNLEKHNADNVGGTLEPLPSKNTFIAKAIALSLSNKFGVGNSFKAGAEKAKWVDAVAFGCFKKEFLKEIGLYNVNMARSQDMELNLRLKKKGGKILLVPSIKGYYYAQPDLKSFFKHNFIDGLWVTYPLKFKIRAFSSRHLIPFLFVLGIIGLGILSFFFWSVLWIFLSTLFLYLLVNFHYSIKTSVKQKDIKFLFLMPIVFAARHIGYGLGSIWGLIKVVIKR